MVGTADVGPAMTSQNQSGSNGFGHQLGTVLVWFRRDLRVADNPALCAAVQAAKVVVPVYLWAPKEEGQFQPGRCSRWWLHHSLQAFTQDLSALGCKLIMRRTEESRVALMQLVQETGAQALFFNHLYDPISMVRDNECKAAMAANNILCQSFNGDVLYEPWEILGTGGQPFTNYEEYWGRVMSMPYPPPSLLPIPTGIGHFTQPIDSLKLEELELMSLEEQLSNQQLFHTWAPGSRGAHAQLRSFVVQRLRAFSIDRSKTDRDSTSRLSPHVHYGEVSVRQIYYVVTQQVATCRDGMPQGSISDYLRQMGFREYARYLSFHFPFTHERSLLEHLRAVPWSYDQRLFKLWRQGRTGYPLVDAGMRQLWSSGWLHNRARVVCASFLVKHLLLPWQWGLKHFWDALLDADLECDALGWQFCSGCLSDAHPFYYMMDHRMEAQRYDPEGNWVRRWLPVLARMPTKWIHRPWEAPPEVLEDAGVELGGNYELPIVHEGESLRSLRSACEVIEQAAPNSGRSSDPQPFRQPSTSKYKHAAPAGQLPFNGAINPNHPSDNFNMAGAQPYGESHAAAMSPQPMEDGEGDTPLSNQPGFPRQSSRPSSDGVASNQPQPGGAFHPGSATEHIYNYNNGLAAFKMPTLPFMPETESVQDAEEMSSPRPRSDPVSTDLETGRFDPVTRSAPGAMM